MYSALDMAEIVIDLCIDKKEETGNSRYCADFYKINKLLYIAQERTLCEVGEPLFQDTIYAKACGPYIESLGIIFLNYGNGEIKTRTYNDTDIGKVRKEILENVVNEFGIFDRSELGQATKATSPYKNRKEEIYASPDGMEQSIAIPLQDLKFNEEDKLILNELKNQK